STGAWPLNTLLTAEEIEHKVFDDSSVHRYMILDEKNKAIGTLGFREVNVPARSATIYIVIGEQEYWNKGYGTDALTTFISFLFKQWNFHRLTLDTWDGNNRALKVYQKLGFQIEGRLREARYVLGEYRDAIVLGLLKKDFIANTVLDNNCR
nr:GNAT family protein [Desulfitobacterium hafniense]